MHFKWQIFCGKCQQWFFAASDNAKWESKLFWKMTEDHYAQARNEGRRWCIHSGFKTQGQSQPKSETEGSGSSKNCDFTVKFKNNVDIREF